MSITSHAALPAMEQLSSRKAKAAVSGTHGNLLRKPADIGLEMSEDGAELRLSLSYTV